MTTAPPSRRWALILTIVACNCVAAAHPDSSKVQFTSNPSAAEIEVDGSFVGQTPSSLELPAGKYAITISRSGYARWTRTIQILPGTTTVHAELTRGSSATARQALTPKPESKAEEPKPPITVASPRRSPVPKADRIESMISTGQFGLAEIELERALVQDPESIRLLLLKADLLEKQSRFGPALELLAGLDKTYGTEPTFNERYAVVLHAASRNGEALERALAAERMGSASERNLRTLAATGYHERKFAIASRAAEKLLLLRPRDPFALNVRAGVAYYTNSGDWREKAADVAMVDGQRYWSLLFEGWEWARAGQIEKAETQIQQAINQQPHEAGAYTLGAAIEIAAMRLPQAINFVDAAIAQKATDDYLMSTGIYSYVLSGNQAKAQAMLKEFEQTTRDEGEFVGSACILHYAFSAGTALKYCARYVELRPRDYQSHANLAWAALDAGNLSLAAEQWNQANLLSTGENMNLFGFVDLAWGLILREYNTGDKKAARQAYRWLIKVVPAAVNSSTLRSLPLAYSAASRERIDQASHALR